MVNRKCKNCSSEIDINSIFYGNCGTKIDIDETTTETKVKEIALQEEKKL